MQVENSGGGGGGAGAGAGAGAGFDRRPEKEEEKEEEEKVIDRVIESSPDDRRRLYLPPGYRFHPNDDELICGYLLPKMQNTPLPWNHIKDVNLYDYNPEELAAKYECSDREWFFFTPRDRKYKNGSRPNRAAGRGYWKATGADKPINSDCKTVGFRKALVFYIGKPPKGKKTNWIMYEFRVKEGVFEGIFPKRNRSSMRLDDWVLCKISEKLAKEKVSKESPTDSPGDHEDKSPTACLIDYTNKSEIASQRDYDNEQMKVVMEESSYGNIMSAPEIKSEVFYSSVIPTTMPSVYPLTNLYNSNSWDPYDMLMGFEPLEPPYLAVPLPVYSNSTLDVSNVGVTNEGEGEDEDMDQLEILKDHLDRFRHRGGM
ncbi:hypothetical protein AAC387_Pa02g1074 [Persea americana]